MQAIRLSNPAACAHPVIKELLLKAAKECAFGQADKIADDMAEMVQQPEFGCWIAVDAQEGPLAVIICCLPTSCFMEQPQIVLFYSQRPAAAKLVLTQALEFIKTNGYNKFWAINRSGHSDEVMAKYFDFAGFTRPIGNMLEYDF